MIMDDRKLFSCVGYTRENPIELLNGFMILDRINVSVTQHFSDPIHDFAGLIHQFLD